MRSTTTALSAAALTAALTAGLAGAAHADLYGVDDPRDTHHGSDVLALQVRNGQDDLTITTIHQNLRRDPASGSGAAIYIDTNRHDRGPEYVFAAGLFEGTDYVLRHTEGFGVKQWGKTVENGDYSLRINYRKERARFQISQVTLREPDAVRVAVRVSGTRSDGSSRGLVDWVGKPRSFSLWIDRG